jgi:hypothetical protein
VIIPSARRATPRGIVDGVNGVNAVAITAAIAAAVLGTIVAFRYHRLGLTLSHYDARGHLAVARRVFDNITPGWQQIGAIWLPLPHLIDALPVQVDAVYRSGASAVAISIASFAVTTGAVTMIVGGITDSAPAAAAAALVFALNPNILYLQATPLTEPLLMALLTAAISILAVAPFARIRTAALLLALACLTRYEAWPVAAAAFPVCIWARWRRGRPLDQAAAEVAVLGISSAAAMIGFAIFSRAVVGRWLVVSGFFVPENKALGDGLMAAKEIAWGLAGVGGTALVWIAAAGLAGVAVIAVSDRRRADALVVLTLLAAAAVPWAAFYQGHPFRVRYVMPLVLAEAIGCGVAAGAVRRASTASAAVVIAVALFTLRPLDVAAPIVLEAQWDRPNVPARARVTECLGAPRPGQKIMASMGSLGHYMQEASQAGYRIRDFLHEGNGDIWLAAIDRPRPFADWILIEEKAGGGDMLALIARQHPHFLDGYSRLCEGAGLALYKRD